MVASILNSQAVLLVLAVLLLLLYGYRYLLGTSPIYIASGLYFIFVLLVGSNRLVPDADATHALTLYNGILWLPFVLLLLIVYELEGTRAAQRFYLGLVVATLLFLFLSLIIFLQPIQSSEGILAEFLLEANSLLTDHTARSELLHGIFTHLFLFLLVPILYQGLINKGTKYGLALFASMVVYMVMVEAFSAIFIGVTAGSKAFYPALPSSWVLHLGSAVWLALVGHVFLVLNAPLRQKPRKAMKFLTGFVDFFFSPEHMARSLSEWSERYQLVVENSSELILLLTQEGKILNMNRVAARYLGKIIEDPGFRLEQVVYDNSNRPWKWQEALPPPPTDQDVSPKRQSFHFNGLFLRVPERKPVDLDLSVSRAQLEGQPIAVLIGRDVTEQREEERRRKTRREQMLHSQRLESLGELAGGIAHDFNNLMQSIQMSADALKLKCPPESHAAPLVDNIEEGCRRATALTSQLLGFARKGKFHAEELEVKTLLDHALQLFKPVAKGLECKILCEPVPLFVFVDEIQLAQVLLNMLINARDALKDAPEPRRITLRGESVRPQMPEWEFRPNREARAEDYICLHVRDNGCGMTEAVRQKVFEPFFTTKPAGHGTGMGLPMAFGCIANHHGWIHVSSAPGEGCDITIFLPKAGTPAAQGGLENAAETTEPQPA